MRTLMLVCVVGCGADVATFPEASVASSLEPSGSQGAEITVTADSGPDPVEVEPAGPRSGGAWPPIRPGQDGPPSRQREAWPFEVDTRKGPPPAATDGGALRAGVMAPEQLR